MPTLPERASVVIVGGGYAGLSAALRLRESGVDALVLEAASRVGGRTLSERNEQGVVIDHGGQWVGPTQRNLLELADHYGVERFPTYDQGRHLELWADGTIRPYSSPDGPEDGPGMAAYLAALETIDALAGTVDTSDPTRTPNAVALDSETVYSYLKRTVADPDACARIALAVQSVWTVEPRDISMLHFLFYVASAGDIDQLMGVEGCAQEWRFTDGAQETARRMAADLGDRVCLDTPVHAVTAADDDPAGHGLAGQALDVRTAHGTVRADRVICAVPPPAAQRITFDPPLPVERARWLAKSPMGEAVKIHVGYETPFWREEGLSGEATAYGDPAVGFVFDNSPHDAAAGVLVCFVYADRTRPWAALPAEQRKRQVLDTLVRLFGERAGAPVTYAEKNWAHDALIGGAYAANPTPGTWVEFGSAGWRSPAGGIHWAGTETADTWNGYIDGAISSGRRAAGEVVATLRG